MDNDRGIGKSGGSGWPLLRAAAVAVALLALCSPRPGQAQNASEYQVKAAYLYNFVKLAAWPKQGAADDSEPLWIGVFGGDDEFLEVLTKTVEGKSVANHTIHAKRVNAEDGVKSCRAVFVRASAGRKRSQEAIAAGVPVGVLLIGEDDNFLQQGGMINLFLQSGKIRFAVNRDALDQAGIQVSPELLRLAQEDDSARRAQPHASRQLRQFDLPEYPEIARRLKLQGTVQLEVDVRRDGTVKDVRVLGGNPVLAEAFSEAVKRWKYEPAPNETVEKVHYTFSP